MSNTEHIEETELDQEQDEKRSKRKIALLLGLLLLLIICIVSVIFIANNLMNDDNGNNPGIVYDLNAEEGGWDQMSEEEITAALNSKVDEGMINISMNTSPVFSDGTAKGSLWIVNELINNYPQKVEIYLVDGDELIYTSGAIPVGSKIETDRLDKELEAGTYECLAMFHNLDPITGESLGSAGAKIKITIQN